MAATELTINHPFPDGVLDVGTTAQAFNAADGAQFKNDGKTRVIIQNSGAGVHVITVVTPNNLPGGMAIADKTFSIAAGKFAVLPYFSTSYFNDANGYTKMTSDGTQTEVKALVIRE